MEKGNNDIFRKMVSNLVWLKGQAEVGLEKCLSQVTRSEGGLGLDLEELRCLD